MRFYGYNSIPGAPGNNFYGNMIAGVDLPFGGGNQYKNLQQQYQPFVNPNQYDPVRIYPKTEPGREGAIPIQFQRAALPGMPGNVGGMSSAVGNRGEIQAFEDALTLPQNIRGSKYRYEQETAPSFFHGKRVY